MAPIYSWSEYEEIPFATNSLAQARLDIKGSRRVSALPWRGQFSPELAEYLIGEFLEPGAIIDPFCGSGTTLIEAARQGNTAFGSEVNPAAYILSRVYELTAVASDAATQLRSRVLREVKMLDEAGFQEVVGWAMAAEDYPEKIVRDAILLLASGNSSEIKPGRMLKAANQVASLLEPLPTPQAAIRVELGDARTLPIPDASVNGLLTSPPYINVFNYHQNYRNAVEALGWGVLSSAKAEFGSNRKHRQNRFLTVVQYAQDIAQALSESARVLKSGSTAVWVVGRESRVRGVPIPNPLIVFEAARQSGHFELVGKQERSFTSRYGQRVYEDVLILRRADVSDTPRAINCADLGRDIGTKILASSLDFAGEVRSEVESAIVGSAQVLPSVVPAFTRPAEQFERHAPLVMSA